MAKPTWTITALAACTTHTRKQDCKKSGKKKGTKYTDKQGFIPAAMEVKDGEPTGLYQLLLGPNGEVLLGDTQQAAMNAVRKDDSMTHAKFDKDLYMKMRRKQMEADLEKELQAEADAYDTDDADEDGDESSESEEGDTEASDAE